MKVLHLMGSLRPSGMERMFLSAAKYLVASDVESIVVGQGRSHSFIPELCRAGYRVETIGPLKSISGVIAWMRLLRSERPDVIHIHTEGAFVLSVLGAKCALPGTPIIRTVHNVFNPSGRARRSRILQSRFADFAVSEFVAVSSDVQSNERLFKRNPRLIFNWVDDKFFTARDAPSQPDAHCSAVIVGNPSPIKNHKLALSAVLNSRCDLYYHGDETNATVEEKRILDELERQSRLRYRGVGDPTLSLQSGSVFLLPSKHEGMPIALSEALVVGVPSIVNDSPGVQWARNFPGVTIISGEQDAWDAALMAVSSGAKGRLPSDSELPLDLSAKRGVEELVRTYRSVIARRSVSRAL